MLFVVFNNVNHGVNVHMCNIGVAGFNGAIYLYISNFI